MVLIPTFKVCIGSFSVKAIKSITVTLTEGSVPSQATITIPTTKRSDLERFSINTEVNVHLGFTDEEAELGKVFTGWITGLSETLPLVITAEDGIMKAKEQKEKKTYGTDDDPIYYSDIAKDLIAQAGLSPNVPLDGPGIKQHSVQFNKDQSILERLDILSRKTQWIYHCIPGTDEIYFGPAWPFDRGHLQMNNSPLVFRAGNRRADWPGSWGNVISIPNLDSKNKNPYSEVTCHLQDRIQTATSIPKSATVEGVDTMILDIDYCFSTDTVSNENYAERCAREKLYLLNSAKTTGTFFTFGNPNLLPWHPVRLEWHKDLPASEYSGKYNVKGVNYTYDLESGFRMSVDFRTPPGEL
ncbi:hypothetical protein GF359_05060 [candidate division WOR-3 bacterium]|uniref:Uncharacterized protein n=1 Tax=candidate division WOR-3 bacterium TaxID=2052148 RepID=A0A9D5K9E7_UNCW3|nr:hypothetical protein [candidate division WOR-3 bacterium]MBD3364565.1 hypothetical protein [candidate division WOR-3 bacterium]